jgi:hypothetical protein
VLSAFRRLAPALVGLASATTALLSQPAQAGLFDAKEVETTQFVLVAAPIPSGGAQLNIYEQKKDTRPCFSREGNAPTTVKPLLATFDFTGICGRYMDSNGYSVRIGEIDYGSAMRLRVEILEEDIVLMSTGPNGGEVVMARAGGIDDGYVELKLEPGWSLKRRHYGERALGHLYVHNESLPIRRDQE